MDDAFIIQANIVRYRELLATCTDEAQRRTLEKLLVDAMHQLRRLTEPTPEGCVVLARPRSDVTLLAAASERYGRARSCR